MRQTVPLALVLLLLVACTRPASTRSPISSSSQPTQMESQTEIMETRGGPGDTHSPILEETSEQEANFVTPTVISPREVPVTRIPLTGPISESDAEISGMAWYHDFLILLPQYPNRFQGGDLGALFFIPRAEIISFLEGETPGPLEPSPIPLYAPGLLENVSGFEGFEAIAFYDERVYLSIETRPGGMMGYLALGFMSEDLSQVIINSSSLVQIPPQTDIVNLTDESIIIFGDRLMTLYEANGQGVNPHPIAHMFNLDLQLLDTLAFPNIEYRITDATPPDDFGRFWAINFFFPGDTKLRAESEPLETEFGQGITHADNRTVERLVEFQFSESGIVLSETAPIQIELLGDAYSRNWEAIARLDGRGFLLATDKFPETVFGFVPLP